MIGTIISLASGALGGNLAGSLMKNSSMGTLWNSIAGIAGGGLGGSLLSMLAPDLMGAAASGGAMDLSSILSSVASGGVGGGVLMAVISMIKKAIAK